MTGAAPARLAQYTEIENSLPIIEAASIALIFVVVAIAFRSLGAPLVALATAGITFLLAIRILPWAGERAHVTVPKEVQPIIVVLLLGLVTDYTIFFLSGMRRRIRQGEPRVAAARGTVVEVAPIVFTAGLIVAAGTAALVVGKLEFFRAFGPGLALTTVISMVVAITLVPALIALFGNRLFGKRVREEGAAAAEQASLEPERAESEPPRPGAESGHEPGPLTRRGPLAGLLLRITRPVTAMRRTPELAREHGTAPWRMFVARVASSRPVALPIAIVAIGALGARGQPGPRHEAGPELHLLAAQAGRGPPRVGRRDAGLRARHPGADRGRPRAARDRLEGTAARPARAAHRPRARRLGRHRPARAASGRRPR